METQDDVRRCIYDILASINFTATERRIIQFLADGEKHKIVDVVHTVGDEFTSRENISVHISAIRKKLNPFHHTIICSLEGRIAYYRYVLFASYLTLNHKANK